MRQNCGKPWQITWKSIYPTPMKLVMHVIERRIAIKCDPADIK
jgi:hypothetical protein